MMGPTPHEVKQGSAIAAAVALGSVLGFGLHMVVKGQVPPPPEKCEPKATIISTGGWTPTSTTCEPWQTITIKAAGDSAVVVCECR